MISNLIISTLATLIFVASAASAWADEKLEPGGAGGVDFLPLHRIVRSDFPAGSFPQAILVQLRLPKWGDVLPVQFSPNRGTEG